MSVDRISVMKNRVGPQPELAGRIKGRSDEHAQFSIENPTEAKSNPKKMTTTQTTDSEVKLSCFDSQQFLNLVKYSSKGEDSAKSAQRYLKDFKRSVYSQGENLKSNIGYQKAQLSSHDVEFSERFRMGYLSSLHGIAAGQALDEHSSPLSGKYDNILYQRSAEVLSGATSLVGQFQKSCSELEDQQSLFTTNIDWQEDYHEMRRIFDIGRRVGELKVESILTNVNKTQLDTQTAEVSHLLYNKRHRLASNLTWNEAVRKQEKAVMRLVNTLPWE